MNHKKFHNMFFLHFIAAIICMLSNNSFTETYTVTNVNDNGPGTLRQAIVDANNNPGLDNIFFNISGSGPHIIKPGSVMREIVDPVVIDGYTQPGAVVATASTQAILMIVLDGSLTPAFSTGLRILAGGTTIRGLVINNYKTHGLALELNGGNLVEGNYIGTDVTGTLNSGNAAMGIHINNSPNNIIGGSTPAARNIIAANDYDGISLTGVNATGNHILGNYIGVDASGTVYMPNGVPTGGADLRLNNSPGNIIGGENPESRNIIPGIAITNPGANNNIILGNFIGTDVTGLNAITSVVMAGIFIIDAHDNVIGPGNVISGKGDAGVHLIETEIYHNTTGNLVIGNYIGTVPTGLLAVPNRFGVMIENASYNTISENIIAFSKIGEGNYGGVGIEVKSAWGVTDNDPIGNRITANQIFSNDRIGIDLNDDGVTPNDLADDDTGPNNLMNYPVILSANVNKQNLIIKGIIDTQNPEFVKIEFFANTESDPTGYGEGMIYLGNCTPNQKGKFTCVLSQVNPGTYITATATDAEGNTSEFAQNIEVSEFGNLNRPTVTENSTDDYNVTLAAEFGVFQNYPNPFNPATTIEFTLPKAAFATLTIYNVVGEKVATLISENLTAGSYKYQWDARGLASGVYFYKLEAEGFVQTKKMLLLR